MFSDIESSHTPIKALQMNKAQLVKWLAIQIDIEPMYHNYYNLLTAIFTISMSSCEKWCSLKKPG